jgi:lysyl-tRNA synthetase class I
MWKKIANIFANEQLANKNLRYLGMPTQVVPEPFSEIGSFNGHSFVCLGPATFFYFFL